jgi:AraC-like DNA-binding protein
MRALKSLVESASMPQNIPINLHPVNFIIISGILQCIILAGILIFYKKENKIADVSIGLVVLICSVHFSWPLIIDTNIADIFRWSLFFPYSYLLAIGPLLLMYTKSLSIHGFQFQQKDWIHFLPVLIEALLQLIFIFLSIRREELFYEVPGFLMFRIVEFIAAGISIFIYAKQALAILKKHELWVVDNFSDKKNITLFWLYQLIHYFRILLSSWLVFELSFLIFQHFQLHFIPVYLLLYLLLIVMTYSCYWIGIQAMIKSEVLVQKTAIETPVEQISSYSKLSHATLNEHVKLIVQMMENERLYLDESLSLRMLASRLNLDPNLVSHVLNTIVGKSFYDYVNEFRVNEVKRKIQDPSYSHLKIVELAFESGFNSKATFNRVFKKVTGKSPSQYRGEIS